MKQNIKMNHTKGQDSQQQ